MKDLDMYKLMCMRVSQQFLMNLYLIQVV